MSTSESQSPVSTSGLSGHSPAGPLPDFSGPASNAASAVAQATDKKSDLKLWQDSSLHEAIEALAKEKASDEFLSSQELELWKELMSRILEHRAPVQSYFVPDSLLIERSFYAAVASPRDGQFSWGSVHLLPSGYHRYEQRAWKDETKKNDDGTVEVRHVETDQVTRHERTYGDLRFQRYWLNAFHGKDGIVLRFSMFHPYDRECFNPAAGAEHKHTAQPNGYSMQDIHGYKEGKFPKDLARMALICLSSKVSLDCKDRGPFWKSLREEMVGISANYLDLREDATKKMSTWASQLEDPATRKSKFSYERWAFAGDKLRRHLNTMLNRWL